MINHTPGPWQVSKKPAGNGGTSHSIWRNDEGPDDAGDTNTNYVRIAQHIHKEADAALIAAAPAMFASLMWLRPYAEVQVRHHPNATDTKEWCALLSAIALAEGRS